MYQKKSRAHFIINMGGLLSNLSAIGVQILLAVIKVNYTKLKVQIM